LTITTLLNSQLNVYSERNNKDRFKKLKPRVYVVKEQEDNKKNNNKRTENSFKVKNYKSSYYAADLNVNYYKVKDYN